MAVLGRPIFPFLPFPLGVCGAIVGPGLCTNLSSYLELWVMSKNGAVPSGSGRKLRAEKHTKRL